MDRHEIDYDDGPPRSRTRQCSRVKLLVIDDDPSVREFFRNVLEPLGYDVDTAASGMEGLARFAEIRHAVVLTDLAMPGWSGWEVIDRLRTIDPWAGVIIMTGHAAEGDIERANAERIPLLEKSVSIDRFGEAIASVQERRAHRSVGGEGGSR